MKNKLEQIKAGFAILILLGFWSCKSSKINFKEADTNLPIQFLDVITDTTSIAKIDWRTYFGDDNLNKLIDTALANNQELNMVLQEIAISKAEVLEKQGKYIPFVDIGIGAETEKVGRFTRNGAVEHNLLIDEDKEFPEPLSDFKLEATASWEVDIWRKLRHAKDASQLRYLAQTEGKNYLITQLISEIAESYYELEALDNLLATINQNVEIQQTALENMRQLKEYSKANQLGVNRFEAQLLNTKNQQYVIKQKITETENKLHFLTGNYPATISRNSNQLMTMKLERLQAGIPSQLLENRPDIRQAELEMAAAKLDVKSAKAHFYPNLNLKAGLGYQAFNPKFLFNPESLIYNIAGDLVAPLINRNEIKAQFNMASARQVQSVYAYQQALVNAYTDVLNQLAKMNNYSESLNVKTKEVELLKQSVDIANDLFKYAKADYVEVLLTQEEVLDAQMELIETKLEQVNTKVQLYRALGGGWK